MQILDQPKSLILALPFILYGMMAGLFAVLVQWSGKEMGYLLGFACYWFVFGLAIPALLAGRGNFFDLLKDRSPLFCRQNWMAALLWVIVSAVTLVMYGRPFLAGPLLLILIAVPLAALHGLCEELFWRGVFVKRFPGSPWLAIMYPAVCFALWHFIPQRIFSAEQVVGFAFSTLFLGLAYGYIAYRTGSAKWTAISHSLNGTLALSGMLAPIFLRLLSH